ncbi:MAG: FAD-dependent oxidoreductase [Verrucomicrobia bacterium]|nr:FAD-dependent oxidoreductase [Verrucomicrobiota bacterium]
MQKFSKLLLICLAVFSALPLWAKTIETDICVYGGNAAGAVAAIQAKRMGHSVVLLEFGKHIGGLTSGGLGATDIGNKAAIGGISREFYQRLGKHYGTNEMWTFEPGVAERTLRDMLKEADVPVYFQQRLASVKKKGNRITQIKMENGDVYRAKMFIDTTYEGDLMAKAKVSFTVGREANFKYGESLNGIRAQTMFHQFDVPVDPYVKRGNPKSGLLPFIQPGSMGTPGDGDHRVQAYNFRLTLTQVETNRLAILPPKNYDPKQYELLARYVEARVASGEELGIDKFWLRKMMPNGKTDVNNSRGFSTDAIGMNWDYPEANYKERAKIWQQHEDYTRGFLHFLATSPRVPQHVREEMQTWGLCKDEFQDTGGWPHQLYVREARRMVSDYVMTEHNCRGTRKVEDPVSLAAYTMDSHNCNRVVRDGFAHNEGDVQVGGFSPYPISYRSIVPKQSECENLFVPVAMSATHIAYGSIRMEPVFMILAQSAATAATLAIAEDVPVQKVNYAKLGERLLTDKQVLEWTGSVKVLATRFIESAKMPGIVVDDLDAKRIGPWGFGSAMGDLIVGHGYSHEWGDSKGKSSMVFETEIPKAGEYEIIVLAPPAGNRSTKVPVHIARNGTELKKIFVNQRTGTGQLSLGTFKFAKGDRVAVTVSNADTTGHVVIDAVQWLLK